MDNIKLDRMHDLILGAIQANSLANYAMHRLTKIHKISELEMLQIAHKAHLPLAQILENGELPNESDR